MKADSSLRRGTSFARPVPTEAQWNRADVFRRVTCPARSSTRTAPATRLRPDSRTDWRAV